MYAKFTLHSCRSFFYGCKIMLWMMQMQALKYANLRGFSVKTGENATKKGLFGAFSPFMNEFF